MAKENNLKESMETHDFLNNVYNENAEKIVPFLYKCNIDHMYTADELHQVSKQLVRIGGIIKCYESDKATWRQVYGACVVRLFEISNNNEVELLSLLESISDIRPENAFPKVVGVSQSTSVH